MNRFHNRSLGGAAPPKNHQLLASRIVSNANYTFIARGIEAVCAPRAEEQDPDSLTPDVGFYFGNAENPLILIELSGSRKSLYRFTGKLAEYRNLQASGCLQFEELFHWNLFDGAIDCYRFARRRGSLTESKHPGQSYSPLLQFDIRALGMHPLTFRQHF